MNQSSESKTSAHLQSSRGSPGDPDMDSGPDPISEHEYRLRIGRALHLLRSTLPQFMSTGLVDFPDSNNQRDHSGSPSDMDQSFVMDPLQAAERIFFPHEASQGENARKAADGSIYHPSIQFVLRPPSASEKAEEQARRDASSYFGTSISFSGRAVYLASSQVLRTALNAIFTHATVEIEKIYLASGADGFGGGSVSPSAWRTLRSPPTARSDDAANGSRSDDLIVRLVFRGHIRVTRFLHEYTTVFRYTFDRESGQIVRHVVERIQPAPGHKVSHAPSSQRGVKKNKKTD